MTGSTENADVHGAERPAMGPVVAGGLILREAEAGDADRVWPRMGRADARFRCAPSADDLRHLVEHLREARTRGRGFAVAACLADATPVGLVLVRALEPHYGLAEWSFAFGSSPADESARESAAAMVAQMVMNSLGARRLEARVATCDTALARSLERLGARAEALLRRAWEHEGAREDQLLWTISGSDRPTTPAGTSPTGELDFVADGPSVTATRVDVPVPWIHGPVRLAGPRCVLRELVPDDAGPLSALLSTPRVGRFMAPGPAGVDGFGQFIQWAHRQRAAARSLVLGVVPEGEVHAVGMFQIHSLSPMWRVAEWGFVLGQPYWGSGLFASGAELLLRFVFDVLDIRRLEARAAADNTRGQAALLKVGASPEGRLRDSILLADRPCDAILWSIDDEEWRGRTGSMPPQST